MKSIGSTRWTVGACWKIPAQGSSSNASLGLPIGSSRLSVLGLHVALELLSNTAVLAAVVADAVQSGITGAAGARPGVL